MANPTRMVVVTLENLNGLITTRNEEETRNYPKSKGGNYLEDLVD
jgi:hypothetical protein